MVINMFYENISLIENPDDLLVLVNKNNKLYKKFIPYDLEIIDNKYSIGIQYLRKEAKNAFEKLCEDAKKNNLDIKAESTYRDYYYQEKLYNNYVKEYGLEYADKCSARPGHSEHQTGLAIDVRGSNGDYNIFEKSNEFDWMKKNCYKYGFVLRYPTNKEHITGFKYAPWHYRYVGEVAEYLYNNNLTFEEYKKNTI